MKQNEACAQVRQSQLLKWEGAAQMCPRNARSLCWQMRDVISGYKQIVGRSLHSRKFPKSVGDKWPPQWAAVVQCLRLGKPKRWWWCQLWRCKERWVAVAAVSQKTNHETKRYDTLDPGPLSFQGCAKLRSLGWMNRAMDGWVEGLRGVLGWGLLNSVARVPESEGKATR